jgi:hypothetical protein
VTHERFAEAIDRLSRTGWLFVHDASRPSLTTMVAGAPVRGSWWGHARGGEIYALANALEDHADVLAVKLLDGKVTFVHRRLFAALIAVGISRSAWQMEKLDDGARALLARVDDEGRVRLAAKRDASVKKLEERLLVYGEQVHTESGRHETELVSWQALARARDAGVPRAAADAQKVLEDAVAIAAPGARLPWQRKRA